MRILFIALIFLLSCSGEDDTGSKVDIFSQQGIFCLLYTSDAADDC